MPKKQPGADPPDSATDDRRDSDLSHKRLWQWALAYALSSMPVASAPIAFAFLALTTTGRAKGGAALVLANIVAQIVGAVPIARLGRRLDPAAYLRTLVVIRTAAYALVVVVAATGPPFGWLIAAVGAAGLVDGAMYAYFRVVLGQMVLVRHLPRALGVSSALTELIFVVAPILASVLGSVDPAIAVAVPAAVGAAPLLLLRGGDPLPPLREPEPPHRQRVLSRRVTMWLACAVAISAGAAAIEIAAVELALSFGMQASDSAIFPVALCCASVAGGAWVGVRNHVPSRRTVLVYLFVSALGSALIAGHTSVTAAVAGSVLVGLVLAPLGTFLSLVLDRLVVPSQRAEVFALLRMARSLGMIVTAALLTAGTLAMAQFACAALVLLAATLVAMSDLGVATRRTVLMPDQRPEALGPCGEPEGPAPTSSSYLASRLRTMDRCPTPPEEGGV